MCDCTMFFFSGQDKYCHRTLWISHENNYTSLYNCMNDIEFNHMLVQMQNSNVHLYDTAKEKLHLPS